MAEEKVLRVIEEDYQPTCGCAGRKCGPHRCWPSLVGWITVGVCLIGGWIAWSYLSGKLDKARQEQVELRGAFATEVMEQAKVGAALTTQEVIERWQQRIETQQAEMTSLLNRAREVNWGLTTSDVERDIQLLERLSLLEQHR